MAILFITSTRIGDAILSTGVLNALMERYPDDPITVACGPPAVPIFASAPRVERILVVCKKRGSRHWFDLWRACVGRRWRVVVDLRRSLLRWLLWAENRHVQPKDSKGEHRVALIARTLNLPPQAPKMWISRRHRRSADKLVGGHATLAAVAPGGNWAGKIWPASRFAETARRVTAADAPLRDARVIITGSADETAVARPLVNAFPPEQVVNALGLSLPTTYAILQRCRLFIGNDSGLMHLAATAGCPTAGLFGPTRDDHYAPWGDHGLVVRTPESVSALTDRADYDHRRTGSLMGNLTVDTVLAAIGAKWPHLTPDPERAK